MYNLCDLPAIQRGVLKETHFSHPLRDSQKYIGVYIIPAFASFASKKNVSKCQLYCLVN
jgi:hypothetical protein